MARETRYWLFKSEPGAYSIDDLAAEKKKTTFWDGVRNYQARNLIRDDMKTGDQVLFYHSNANPAGIAGVAKIVRDGYADHTALDPDSPYYDEKSSADNTRWYMVDIQLVKKFKRLIPLDELKSIKALDGMVLLQKGSRLSVQPVTKKQFETIVNLAKQPFRIS